LAQIGAACLQCEAAVHVFERVEKPFAAFDRTAATGTDRPQWQPLTVVAKKPRPKPRAQIRGLAGTRRAENDEQARRLARRQPAQRVDAPHDIGAAPEKDGRILGLERLEAAIGRRQPNGPLASASSSKVSGPMPAFVRPRLRLLRAASAMWTGD
jgi:hypothetical protein